MLAFAALSFALVQSLVIPVLPTIRAQLHTSGSTVAWLVTAYLLSASVATPIAGRLGDVYGKQRLLVLSLAALALGSVLAVLAPNIGVLITARAVQGLGGGVLPLGFGIVRDEFRDVSIGRLVGVLSSLTAVGSGFGLVVAGPLVSLLGFRALFWLPGLLVTCAALAARAFVPESPLRDREALRWTAALLLAAWLLALLLGVTLSESRGWGSALVLALMAGFGLSFAAWIRTELRSPVPLIDLRLMRLRVVWAVNAVALCMGAGLFAMYAFTPIFLQTPTAAGYGFGLGVGVSGLVLLPQSVASFVTGASSGWLTHRVTARRLLASALVINAVTFTSLALAHDHLWEVLVELTVLGLTFGTILAGMPALVVAAVPSNRTGVAGGMNANIRTIGGAIGTAVCATLIAATDRSNGVPTEAGYTRAYLVLAAVSLVGAAFASALPRSHGAAAVIGAGVTARDKQWCARRDSNP